MTITLRDFITFPFNNGKGITLDQLDGGSAAETDIKYNAMMNRFEAVSLISTVYTALTRENTFAALRAALIGLFEDGGSSVVDDTNAYWASNRSRSFTTRNNDARLDAFWPNGEGAPYAWAALPKYYGWLAGYEFNAAGDTTAMNYGGDYVRTSWEITINGVAYEVASLQLPVPIRESFSINSWYSAPAASQPTILQVTT